MIIEILSSRLGTTKGYKMMLVRVNGQPFDILLIPGNLFYHIEMLCKLHIVIGQLFSIDLYLPTAATFH